MKKIMGAFLLGSFLPGIFGALSFILLIGCFGLWILAGHEEFKNRYNESGQGSC